MTRAKTAGLAAATAVLLAAAPAQAAEMTAAGCEALSNTFIDSGFVTAAREVAAADGMPRYCQVRAMALPEIAVEVRLPMDDWNGKLYQVGCGGFCGALARPDAQGWYVNAQAPGLKKGYATATSNSGHFAEAVVDASWAWNNPGGERDWAYRAIGETNRVAKALIQAFYGADAGNNYFAGCSTGGRLANKAALTYPEMFQGIISGAPAMDEAGLAGTKIAFLIQANTDENGEAILKPGKDKLIGDEVMKQCDEVDGTKDGLIADPRQCTVDLSGLQCGAGGASNECLTEAELGVLEKWYQGPRNAAGEQLYPGGLPYGSEPFWWLWMTGKEGGGGKLNPLFGENYLKYMAYPNDPGPDYGIKDFDIETDPPRLATMARLYNSDDPDLSKFSTAGGKMIVWHGWADAIVTPFKTVDWYDKVVATAGGQDKADAFVRLFMLPGWDHCGLLPAADGGDQSKLDPLTALEAWVEGGIPPTTVLRQE